MAAHTVTERDAVAELRQNLHRCRDAQCLRRRNATLQTASHESNLPYGQCQRRENIPAVAIKARAHRRQLSDLHISCDPAASVCMRQSLRQDQPGSSWVPSHQTATRIGPETAKHIKPCRVKPSMTSGPSLCVEPRSTGSDFGRQFRKPSIDRFTARFIRLVDFVTTHI